MHQRVLDSGREACDLSFGLAHVRELAPRLLQKALRVVIATILALCVRIVQQLFEALPARAFLPRASVKLLLQPVCTLARS